MFDIFFLSEGDEEESLSELEASERKNATSRRTFGQQFQNWSDFFFMLDILASNFSVCDVLIFIGKIDDQIAGFIPNISMSNYPDGI